MTGSTDRERALDRQLIAELLDAYCTAVDERDWHGVAGVFAPDAIVDYSSAGGPKGSPAELVQWLEVVLAPFAVTQHLVMNKRIHVVDDEATSRAAYWSPLGLPAGEGSLQLLFTGGTYRDRLRRNGDGWLIVERVTTIEWSEGPVAGHRPQG